jgi:hypothetical protein
MDSPLSDELLGALTGLRVMVGKFAHLDVGEFPDETYLTMREYRALYDLLISVAYPDRTVTE